MKTMKTKNLKYASDSKFRRITGVKRTTFNKMVEILTEAKSKQKTKGGRPNKLSVSDMLLATLEYLREYRTYAHIAMSYGVSESNTYYAIKWVENTLVKQKEFRLPGRKALLKSDNEFEVVMIDATESPIERPKKNKGNITQARKSAIQ